MSTPPTSSTALSMTSRFRRPEEVHLQEAEVDDVPHAELGDDLLVAALLLERDDFDERLRSDDDACSVDRVGARQALERSGQVDDLLRHRIGVDRLAQLGARLERGLERLSRPFGHELRDAVDHAVGDVEDAPGVTDRGAGGHRRKGDDLGHPVAPVLLRDVVDDAVPTGHGEVDVHVRQVLAGRVQEALEEEAVPHRVDVGDLEAVRGDRPGSGAAPRADADPVLLCEVDEVPDDEEVVREPHLLDRLELEAEPVGEFGGNRAVAPGETLLAELNEVVERVTPLRHRERREEDASELELDRAALRDLERARERVLEARKVSGHLLGRLEEELVGVELPVSRVLERVAGLDTEQRFVREGIVRVEVVHVSRRNERQARLLGECDEQRVDLSLLSEPGVLDLDVRRVAAEDLDEAIEVCVRVRRPALRERARHPAREAARQRHDPLRMPLEELPVDARLVVVALEVAERGELDEIRVALVRLGQQRQVRVPLRLCMPVVGDVDLAADDRLHAGTPGLAVELDRAGERTVVGERHGGHLEPGCLVDERWDAARTVEDRELRVNVEMDEGSAHPSLSECPVSSAAVSREGAFVERADRRWASTTGWPPY